MGVRFEWFRASMTEVGYVAAGCDVQSGEPADADEEESTAKDGALVLCCDEAVVLEGTPPELRKLVERLQAALEGGVS